MPEPATVYDRLTPSEREARLKSPKYPRSAKYDVDWIWRNQVGSHCLWLTEAPTNLMDLRPGERVLNLGCGRAIESVFLAKEFGCQVWAVDLRANPTENLGRIREAGVADLVFPLQADARSLPFAEGFFDTAVTINTYWFFGTDDFYLGRFVKLLRPGARFGLIVPGLLEEIEGEVPAHLRELWLDHFVAYHSPGWWKRHLERTGLVRVEVADDLGEGEGARIFRLWDELHTGQGEAITDNGRYLTFVRLLVRKVG